MTKRFFALPLLLGFGFCATLRPAPPPTHAVAIAAAVNHMVALLRASDGVPAGIVRFDPRVVQSRPLPPDPGGVVSTAYDLTLERSAASTAELRALMRAEAGSLDSARVCASESLRTCTLREAVAVFATSDPVTVGDAAQVIVKAMWLGNLAKQPVQDGVFLVTLRQRGGRWEAVTSRTLVIS